MVNISQQDVKTTSNVFYLRYFVYKNEPFWELEIFTCNVVWEHGDSYYTAHAVSYSKHCCAKRYLLERCCTFFRPMLNNFALQSTCEEVSKRAIFEQLH